jgi:hypothetical protein
MARPLAVGIQYEAGRIATPSILSLFRTAVRVACPDRSIAKCAGGNKRADVVWKRNRSAVLRAWVKRV